MINFKSKVLAVLLSLTMLLSLTSCMALLDLSTETSVTDTPAINSEETSKPKETNTSPQETTTSPTGTTTVPKETTTSPKETTSSQNITTKPPETSTTAPTPPATVVGTGVAKPVNPSSLPGFSGKAYTIVSNNIPNFSAAELTTTAYESYSKLDSLGRCGVAIASCGTEIMPGPDEERGSISSIKPTGWVQAQYTGISGGYLWNRCHLIGWQLSAENANKQNLITGTRYMNIEGMLPFENMVADYIRETGNHVAYRITPIFVGSNLVCSGVQMEAYSIEDEGDGICFNVYCYNVQPNITINYATGESSGPSSETTTTPNTEPVQPSNEMVWVSKTGSKYHSKSSCSNMKNPSQITKEEAIRRGLEPCSKCH